MPERGQYWPAYDEARKYEGSVRHATPDHPLRDAKPANDGNLYPYNSKLRPPPLWIDEDGVEIADQPKVFHSHPHYYPYTAQRPPQFVPPQPQTDPSPGEDNGRNGAW